MPSPFTDRFNTNYVPSVNEIITIRSLIRRGEQTMNDIELRTEELTLELRELKENWEAQRKELDEHKALLSPIKRVPEDILSSIFLAVLESDYGRCQNVSARHPAVAISHVCQHWRNVALLTKLLWSTLLIDIPPCLPYAFPDPGLGWSPKIAKLVEMVQVWIARSDDCHLSVDLKDRSCPVFGSIDPGFEKYFSEGSDFDKLMETLVSSSPRWKNLKLSTFIPQTELPSFPIIRLLAPPPQPTPILTEVTLFFGGPGSQDDNLVSQALITGFTICSAPTLRSLTMGERTLFDDIMRMPIVWSTLENLDFGGYPSQSSQRFDGLAALTLLKECPNLVTCELTLERTAPIPTNRQTPIELPRLRKLVLLPCESHLPSGFARSLILPSLREFEVITGYGECRPRAHHESGLFEVCDRFRSTLQSVTFCYRALTQQALLHCLKCLPDITSLGLISVDRIDIVGDAASATLNSDLFVQMIGPQGGAKGAPAVVQSKPLCPKIQVLRLEARRGDLAEEAFLDFVAARRGGVGEGTQAGMQVARLREVYCGSYPFSDIEPGEGLRERGVDVNFTFKYYPCYRLRSRVR